MAMQRDNETKPGYEGWTLLELMGHRVVAGMVTEVEIAGVKLLRVDVPAAEGDGWQATQFYGGQSIYCITPITEEAARKRAKSLAMQSGMHVYSPPRLVDERRCCEGCAEHRILNENGLCDECEEERHGLAGQQ